LAVNISQLPMDIQELEVLDSAINEAFDLSARERVLLRERVLTDFFGDKQVLEPFYLILVDVRLYLVPVRCLQMSVGSSLTKQPPRQIVLHHLAHLNSIKSIRVETRPPKLVIPLVEKILTMVIEVQTAPAGGGEAGTDEGLTGQRTLSGTVTATETDLGLDLTGLASDRPSAAVSGTAAPPQAAASSTPEPTQALGADAADGSTAQKAGGGCGSRRPRRGQASDQASAAAPGTAVPPQAAASSAPAQPTQALGAEGSAADVPAAKSEGGCCGARRSRGGLSTSDRPSQVPQAATASNASAAPTAAHDSVAADGGSTAQNGGGCCGSRRKGPASATAPGTALPPQVAASSAPAESTSAIGTGAADGGSNAQKAGGCCGSRRSGRGQASDQPSAAAPNLAAPSQAAASSASAVPTAALGSDAADGGSTAQNGGGCCGSRRSRRGPASAAAPGTAPPPQAAASSAPAEVTSALGTGAADGGLNAQKAGGCCGSRRSAAAAAAADPADAVGNGGKPPEAAPATRTVRIYLNYFRKSHPDSDWPYQQLKAAWRKQALKRTLECDADYLLLTTRRSSVRLGESDFRLLFDGLVGDLGRAVGDSEALSDLLLELFISLKRYFIVKKLFWETPRLLELLVITMETVAKEQRSFEALTEIERRQRGNQLRVLLHALQALNCSFEETEALSSRQRSLHQGEGRLIPLLLSSLCSLIVIADGRHTWGDDGEQEMVTEQVTTYRALLLERARTFYHLMAGCPSQFSRQEELTPALLCRLAVEPVNKLGFLAFVKDCLRHCARHFDFYGRIRDGAPVAAMRPETAVQLFEALDALNRLLLASPEAWESARACQELLVEVRHFLHRSRVAACLRRDLPLRTAFLGLADDLRRNLQLHLA
ncbi:hypothetical protein BOX15_Mlig008996g1, partial [Macrostomum lignano]